MKRQGYYPVNTSFRGYFSFLFTGIKKYLTAKASNGKRVFCHAPWLRIAVGMKSNEEKEVIQGAEAVYGKEVIERGSRSLVEGSLKVLESSSNLCREKNFDTLKLQKRR